MELRYRIGLVLLGCSALAIWTTIRLINAPSTEEAMQRSLSALKVPELDVLYSLHRDACSIVKVRIWKWDAECVGVPQHFYRETLRCGVYPPRSCRPATASEEEDCRSFFWSIDVNGKPFDPITHRTTHYASMSSECRSKGTLASEREEMARRGVRPVRVEIYDGVMKRFNDG